MQPASSQTQLRSRPLERLEKHPGIFRRGSRYCVVYRDDQGRQRKRSARTLAEAKAIQARVRTQVDDGSYRPPSRETFAAYARRWVGTYAGRTRHGIREATLADYAARLEQDAIPFLGSKPLTALRPTDVKELAAHVAARGVSPNTVRLALAPVKACLATAFEDGLIPANPAAGVRIAAPVQAFDEDGEGGEDVKALTDDELASLLERLPDEWRLLFAFLAETGLRIGEAIELRWKDTDLGAGTLRVRRRFYRGQIGAPKSRFGRRTLRLAPETTRALWQLRKASRAGDEALVFTAEQGGRLEQSNLMSRVLKPAARAAGIGEWPGFHTFRHTCATRLFRAGWNAVQVQRWLGHHKASFTIDTYVHLLDDDLPVPPPVPAGGNKGATQAAETSRDAEGAQTEKTAAGAGIAS